MITVDGTSDGLRKPPQTRQAHPGFRASRGENQPGEQSHEAHQISLRQKHRVSDLADEVQVLRKRTADRNLKELCGLGMNDDIAVRGQESADLILQSDARIVQSGYGRFTLRPVFCV